MSLLQINETIKSAEHAVEMNIGVGKKLREKMVVFFENGEFPDERQKLKFSKK